MDPCQRTMSTARGRAQPQKGSAYASSASDWRRDYFNLTFADGTPVSGFVKLSLTLRARP